MKNWDLKWAREQAGLSQIEAAAKMGVNKQTWNRWESGSHPTPKGTLKRFMGITQMPPEVQKSRLRYDAEGYPFGYSWEHFVDAADGDSGKAMELADAALEPLEGDEFQDRCRERFRLDMVHGGFSANTITTQLARYDADQVKQDGISCAVRLR